MTDVYQNFLPEGHFADIKRLVMTEMIPWHFSGDGMADVLMRRTDGRRVLNAINGNDPSVLKQGIPDMTRNEDWVPQLD